MLLGEETTWTVQSVHYPDQHKFHAIHSEDIQWTPFPAFPPDARLAILVGDPAKSGPYVTRVKMPAGTKMMPHKHPEDRIYTVLSGVFYIGLGEVFDETKLMAYAPGSVLVLPGDEWHFHWAKSGEYITQITASGPLGLDYNDPVDDPRLHAPISEVSGSGLTKGDNQAVISAIENDDDESLDCSVVKSETIITQGVAAPQNWRKNGHEYFIRDRSAAPPHSLALLTSKAERYVDALFLEIGVPLNVDMARTLQFALLQDFIEVHNEGRRASFDLPTRSP